MTIEIRRRVEELGQLLLDELGAVPSWWFKLYEWVVRAHVEARGYD